jgi:aminoglycoside/choline kinase family phosphotransferase
LAWDEPQGFMLLDDIGSQTMMDVINRDDPQANHGLYMRAVDALLTLQQSSRPGVLPAYDEALLQRELSLRRQQPRRSRPACRRARLCRPRP